MIKLKLNVQIEAKFLRNSFELSQLDGVGMVLMEQQQLREMRQREKEHLLRQLVTIQNQRQKNGQVSNQKPQYMLKVKVKVRHKRHHQGLYIKPQLNHLLQFHN